ncbi:MAG: bifunctional histidinol-phosphatase/imidazoleglycerol-phosphate dehydratase HisB [Tannerellaceae bacterium]|jgi:imidazoleglycerol-phosphate dehydratase/histidinol-phosphatase|nr:bifunctional histidinol-phosphatase/imidazoleglycerol-phosphate dehydratase HisB [Tannerellaceae bacterium]
MKKRALFIDRDGTLVQEVPVTEQLDDPALIVFYPKVIRNLYFLRQHTDFEFVMVSNQDGLGTPTFPRASFDRCHSIILRTLEGEGIRFDKVFIDDSRPEDRSPRRKPGTGMLTEYLTGDYDLTNSYVIGDRWTDVELATNLGTQAILLKHPPADIPAGVSSPALVTDDWDRVAEFLYAGERTVTIHRKTKETDIHIVLNLDGTGRTEVATGLGMFDHLLDQIGRHAGFDLSIHVTGDLHVDEHHTMEDTALALGEALRQALGDKRGIERYGYALPMDDCLALVALDFGGRPWLEWQAAFARERVGDVPTEMFPHFFKSLSDAAMMNLHIRSEGTNEHHKIEGIFKALARALRMAVRRDIYRYELPTTKGIL